MPHSQAADLPGDKLDRVVLTAMSRDASLQEGVARRLAAMALDCVSGGVDPDDAPELARRLLEAERDAGASSATVVAAAVADVLAEHEAGSAS